MVSVVGITQLGAEAYCKWRNTHGELNGTYRLPTLKEFQFVLREGYEAEKQQRKVDKARKHEWRDAFNFYRKGDINMPLPPGGSIVDKFGIYDIQGNVSEIVQDGNIAVGGSWLDSEFEDWQSITQVFDGPKNWVGFRCVCELENRKRVGYKSND